ncbi:MAG: molybdopterin guanine dinucleotide-containing S/N-oxide reductase [Nisaea sp.]|uniref:molybdopterin guanine dinucleotide-containing S/N-oxide reductase n=1 Tax=Nisaea sp. TaxID=2024842 RepID=UPI001B0DA923|nr:molybdopterin guanine dinucleotide-containing S/N-oxide reductase [Nisaea sp.]MBO6562866.1 molybdopterin guanine dinucleotide-containing S/N-oxide reductase [Nisaea sp.]
MSLKTDRRLIPTSMHWGTYFAEVENGKLVAVHDYDKDPAPAIIGPGIVDAVDDAVRVRRPMIRKGWLEKGPASREGRGGEPFVAVPWDEALDMAAAELKRIREQHGNRAIFGGSYGWSSSGRFHHAQSQVHRFLNCIGGYVRHVDTYSYAAGQVIIPHVVGPFADLLNKHTTWPVIAEHSELVVMFGGVPVKNAQVTSGGVGRHTVFEGLKNAYDMGVEFVNISPIRNDIVDLVEADWIAPRPNTDAALMLALAHVIYSEGLHNADFLEEYTVGFEKFLPYLLGETDGQPKTPEWAAAITEVPAEEIRKLARRMANGRTMIMTAWSIQRGDHGEQPFWLTVLLAAMLGQIGLPGGGFGLGYGSENGIGNPVELFKWPALPQGTNAVEDFIPVARISDMLLNPGGQFVYDGQTRTYPDIKAVYWAGGNPFHHHQDLNKLVKAIRQPDTVFVNEIWWTAMARHADFVFPTTTSLERNDLSMTHWEQTIVAMQKAIEPVGESRHDYDVFTGLAERLGAADAFTEGRDEEDWLRHLWDQARQRAAEAEFELPDLETFREIGAMEVLKPKKPMILLEAFREDPEANPLQTPSGKIELYSEEIAGFGYADCPGHPVWLEPYEWLGAPVAETYPLHLISNQPKTRLHSQLDSGAISRGSKIQDREPMSMNPVDAAARGIGNGDVVRLYNDRGACLAGVIVTDAVRPGVVQLSTGAWYDPEEPGVIGSLCKHGNPNVLTRDKGTSSLGQGPSAHSVLVEVEKYQGTPPPVTSFVPPPIEEKA